jgi:alpha-D-ribose 1-methylphosphonate 5-triphosphate synthase subunit PhnH
MKTIDIEKLNRNNFRAIMNALSMPGKIEKIEPFFDSNLLAIANTLLYSEVSYFYQGSEEISLVQAITGTKSKNKNQAEYIFCDEISEDLFLSAKKGTPKDPEFSGTLIFKCEKLGKGKKVILRGPGINIKKELVLPFDDSFIKVFNEKNSYFPLGNEIILISNDGFIQALSRTTKIEVT